VPGGQSSKRVVRGTPTARAHKFRAEFAQTCGRCGERWDSGEIIRRYDRGYEHALCPRDRDRAAGVP